MTHTRETINKCISRIEEHLTSENFNERKCNSELAFLNTLLKIDFPTGAEESKTNREVKTTIHPKGTVLVFIKEGRVEVETERKFKDKLRKDPDWTSESYKVNLSSNPFQTFDNYRNAYEHQKSARYKLSSGEVGYLIMI